MKIVIDTNVLISGVFFGGFPRKILSYIVNRKLKAFATIEIVDEYEETIQEMVARKQGHLNRDFLVPFINSIEIIEPVSVVKASRNPDDDKFIGCAKDAHALYIVSGDKDLLVLEKYGNINIVTAKDFCEKYFPK